MKDKLRKVLHLGVLLAVMVAALTSFYGVKAEAASKLKLNSKKVTLTLGSEETYQLELVGATGKITWKSSNKKVATVSKKGVVTAVAEGKATITAKCGGKKYKCTVTVKPFERKLVKAEDYVFLSGEMAGDDNRLKLLSQR